MNSFAIILFISISALASPIPAPNTDQEDTSDNYLETLSRRRPELSRSSRSVSEAQKRMMLLQSLGIQEVDGLADDLPPTQQTTNRRRRGKGKKKGKKGKGRKGKGRKGRKNRKNRDRKGRKERKNKKRRNKNRNKKIRRGSGIPDALELISDPTVHKSNLRNYVINTGNIDNPEYKQSRADTLRFWATRNIRAAKNKAAAEGDDYDSGIDDLVGSVLDGVNRDERAVEDDIPKMNTPVKCRIIDSLTGRCLHAVKVGCLGNGDEGNFGC